MCVSLPVKLLGVTKVYDYRLQKYCDLEVFWVYLSEMSRCMGLYTAEEQCTRTNHIFKTENAMWILDTDLALSTCTCIAVAQNLHVVIGMASTSSCTLCALANIRLRK